MIGGIQEVVRKVRKDGVGKAFKAAGRRLHSMAFSPESCADPVPLILESILQHKGSLTLIQVGANVGNDENDHIYEFLATHCRGVSPDASGVRAILVEPVRHLFQKLSANYSDFDGVICENAAITEAAGTKQFYRLREGIDLSKHGLPSFAEQLGSFLPERMDSLWGHDPNNRGLREFVRANIVAEPIPCMTLHQLMEKHGIGDLDFLLIDTEGYDYQILRTIDFTRLRPAFLNYERIHLNEDEPRCRELLTSKGYRLRDHGQDTFGEYRSRLGAVTRLREFVYCGWLRLIREAKPTSRPV